VIVVADTSPLNYLIQLGFDSLLPQLYGHIVVPSAVMQELRHSGAPSEVRAWLTHVPGWVHVNRNAPVPDMDLAYLGPGEREAIQLAEEQQAELLLIDERKGRLEAKRRGLSTTGTLGGSVHCR
jgi:predicted nucleic acid-binding protein